jgi:hypothetical protein
MAIAILTTIFVFPETMNYAHLVGVSDQLGRLRGLMGMWDEVLEGGLFHGEGGEGGDERREGLKRRIKEMRAMSIEAQKTCGFFALLFCFVLFYFLLLLLLWY